MQFTIEPYISIVVAILGVAYPIILQVIARIDEKYESEKAINLLKSEKSWMVFNGLLIASLLAIFIWSLQLDPPTTGTWIDKALDGSAKIIVVVTSIALVFPLFVLISKILIFI